MSSRRITYPLALLTKMVTSAIQIEGDCVESPADEARRPFPDGLGSFLASYGNIGKGRSHALQFEVNRRFARSLMFNVSYTLLDQKSSGLDIGNSSLGGATYNQFNPNRGFCDVIRLFPATGSCLMVHGTCLLAAVADSEVRFPIGPTRLPAVFS